jgi:glycosyltransferase involved in cell wall biosynthesis
MVQNVLFSIIVPTSNRPETLLITLNSIKQQKHTNYEVIIVNNGTNPSVIEKYNKLETLFDERFVFLNFHNDFSQGFGPAIARNIGINAAKGEYIAFCDDDDKWINEKYLTHVENAIKLHKPEIVLSEQSGIELKKDKETITREVWFPNLKNSSFYEKISSDFGILDFDYFNHEGVFPHLNITIYKKSLLTAINNFDRSLWYEEDLDLFLRAAQEADLIYFNEQKVAHHYIPNRKESNNVSSDVDNLKKHQVRYTIAQKILLNTPKLSIKKYSLNLLTYAAKNICVQLVEKKEFDLALYYAKFALCANFKFKWFFYSNYLLLKTYFRPNKI